MNRILLAISVSLSLGAFAAPPVLHRLSPEEKTAAQIHNQQVAEWGWSSRDFVPVERAFAEYENTKYFLMSASSNFNSFQAKTGMLRNLPKEVTAIILTEGNVNSTYNTYAPYISKDRLKVVQIHQGTGDFFWARDTFPVPVYEQDSGELALVRTMHRAGPRAATTMQKYLSRELIPSEYSYPGGNFLSDQKGNCFYIYSPIPETDMKKLYGCKTVTSMPMVAGIGHIDEHLKFFSDEIALTDLDQYESIMKDKGYTVVRIPRPEQRMETYINSLQVNGTLFMPAYGEGTDAKAQAVYEGLGLKVFPLPSKQLSNQGMGSLHCITMTYPAAAAEALGDFLGIALE